MSVNDITWQIYEEKVAYSRDRETILFVVTITAFVLALLFKFYIFSVFILIAGFTVIYSGRKAAREFDFELDQEKFRSNDTEYLYKEIVAFRVIDDPGDRARLIFRLNSIVGTVAIPIFDKDIERIKTLLKEKGVDEDDDLDFSFLDRLATYL